VSAATDLDALLASEHVTPATREALKARMGGRFERRYFTEAEFVALQAVAARLVPHDPRRTDLAGCVDDRLFHRRSDGWRYADSPPDPEACRALLAALPGGFARLDGEAQDAQLSALERDFPHPFEDLLAELTESYYSHPEVQVALGYLGFADAPRWDQIGLNETDPRERAYSNPKVPNSEVHSPKMPSPKVPGPEVDIDSDL